MSPTLMVISTLIISFTQNGEIIYDVANSFNAIERQTIVEDTDDDSTSIIGEYAGPDEDDEAFLVEEYGNIIEIIDEAPSPTMMNELSSQDENFAGYFSIPDVSIMVPVYYCYDYWDANDPRPQQYTNRENSAALLCNWTAGVSLIVADHVNQSFNTLSQVTPGTISTIYWSDNTCSDFVCYESGRGINNDVALIDQSGADWNSWTCDMVAYTCISGSEQGISITKWRYA